MKKIAKLFFVGFAIISLCGCGTSYDYSLYYSYEDSQKGIEIYCWQNNNDWASGILMGTDRAKAPEEVKELQDNLPCPLNTMREILEDYPKEIIDYARVIVTSVPPQRHELGGWIDENNIYSYVYVYEQLNLEFPSGHYEFE